MTLAGTVCCQDGSKKTFAHCQVCSLAGSCSFPRPLIDEMAQKEESREGAGISATGLLGCPRQYCLQSTEPYYESPADYHARWRGTGVHAMAEAYGPYPGVIQERRIRLVIATPSGEAELTGKPDWFDANRGYLEDWKSTKKAPSKPYDDHEAQVNIYAMLIEEGIFDDMLNLVTGYTGPDGYAFKVNEAAIRYIDADRSVAIPVTLWSEDYTRSFVERKMEPIVKFLKTGELPEGIAHDKDLAWKTKYCAFRGTGKCCGDQ